MLYKLGWTELLSAVWSWIVICKTSSKISYLDLMQIVADSKKYKTFNLNCEYKLAPMALFSNIHTAILLKFKYIFWENV